MDDLQVILAVVFVGNNEINEMIIQIWKKYPSKRGDFLPLLYPLFESGGILFIGLNPSSSDKRKAKGESDINRLLRTSIENCNEEIKKKIVERERKMKVEYKYYKKFRDIAKELGTNWEHVDLFYYREKSSGKLAEIALGKNASIKEDFFMEQFNLLDELLKTINPRVIVVANHISRDILFLYKKDLISPDNIKPDEKTGHHTILVNGKKIPIFFSSMLTGGRALDKGPYYRLIWQLKKALNEQAH